MTNTRNFKRSFHNADQVTTMVMFHGQPSTVKYKTWIKLHVLFFYKIVSGQQDGSEGKGMSHQVDNPSTAPGAHMEEEESTTTSYPMTSTSLAW